MRERESDTLSLFSGMGGLDLAAKVAGLRVGLSTDRDYSALEVLERALGTPTLACDSGELSGDALIDQLGSAPRYVIGGPPCGPFSHAGFWIESKRDGKDPAASCLEDYVRLVKELQPAAFCLENVPGLAFKTHAVRFRSLLATTRRAGYSVSWQVLRGDEFLVPQARRRLFVVGIKDGPRFAFPKPSTVRRTSGWAISDLAGESQPPEPDEHPRGEWADLIPEIPPGKNYLYFTDRGDGDRNLFKYRGRYWSFLLKLHRDRPAPTLPAQRVTFNGPFHWDGRHLRVRELARLQGFPDSYPVAPRLRDARRQLGNAVPPLLGASVLWELRRHLGDADGNLPGSLQAARSADASVGVVDEAVGAVASDGD